ncbi:uncharacterized protein LOC132190216 [Corylus avellana]|uniref:uncharacterized protein LOC132190216 n=1 Tax=Corylus avellana TaxID=13451 RepID=UPI00286A5B79|nr:uncharacterized protein LOC132190216 [Corylus avellana]
MMRRSVIAPVTDFTTDDIDAADVLLMLYLPRVFLKVERWAVKRRRSSWSSMQSFRRGVTGSGGVALKCEAEGAPAAKADSLSPAVKAEALIPADKAEALIPADKAEALSPATPLSFPPSSESDEKPKQDLQRKFPQKRKREEWMVIIDGLNQDRALLKEEIENMRRNCDNVRAFNLELKAKLSSGPCLETGKIGAENKDSDQIGQLHPLLPSSNGSGMAHSNMGPSGLPDLNISAEGTIGIESSGPVDLNVANKNLGRAMALAAQARHRRMLIRRIKKIQVSNNTTHR